MASFTQTDQDTLTALGAQYYNKVGVIALEMPAPFSVQREDDPDAPYEAGDKGDFIVMEDPTDLLAGTVNPLRVVLASEFALRYEKSEQ